MENFHFPDEIVLKILGYLGLGELIQCSKVSRRFNTICKDKSLSYRSSLLIMKDLKVEDQKILNSMLIARPEVKKVVVHSVRWQKRWRKKTFRSNGYKEISGSKDVPYEEETTSVKSTGSIRYRDAFHDSIKKYYWNRTILFYAYLIINLEGWILDNVNISKCCYKYR